MKILKILGSIAPIFAIFFFICLEYGNYKEITAPDYLQFYFDSGLLNRPTPQLIVPTTTLVALLILNKSAEANIDPVTALDIAICESRLDPKAKSKISSAKGVYQFVNKTWENYCTGDRLNLEDNINCFFKLYKENPSWWECK